MIRLATSPTPHTVNNKGFVLDMLKAKSQADTTSHGIPGPDPRPEPNPAPDTAAPPPQAAIDPADWDILFKAVTERLQTCLHTSVVADKHDLPADKPTDHLVDKLVDKSANKLANHVSHHVTPHLPGTVTSFEDTVSDCVESLTLLRDALPHDWKQYR